MLEPLGTSFLGLLGASSGIFGPIVGFSGASRDSLGASGGLDECRLYGTSGTAQGREVFLGGVSG